ncbi:VOC family protein [Enterocloster aldenensis]|uniref:VOC family protein n=1 Tax=Enterocloster aldenensis TaxID=358742 RepID=UPI00269AF656
MELQIDDDELKSEMMILKVDYITLQTSYPDKMKDFYVKYFGAEANLNTLDTDCPDPMYILSFQGGFKIKLAPAGRPMYGFAARTSPCPHNPVCLAFRLGSRKRVNTLTSQLILEGHEIISEPQLSAPAHYSSCIFDPEGNIVELIS